MESWFLVQFFDYLKGKKLKIIWKWGMSDQRLKNIFLDNLYLLLKVYVDEGPMPLLDFVD